MEPADPHNAPNQPSQPEPSAPPRDPRLREYRRVLTVFTGLLIMGLLTAALWPTGNPAAQPPVAVTPRPQTVKPPSEGKTPERPTPPPPAAVQPPAKPEAPKSEPPKSEPPRSEPAQPLPSLPEGEPSRLVVSGDRSCPQIALTYDAGSGADGAAAILDVLKKHGVISTFFLTGKWVEKYPDLAKRIAAEGHEIANHTYSHPDLTKLPPDEVIKQIKDGEEAIRKITGKETRPLFREPYGAFNDAERRLVRQAGYSYSVYWDVDTLDWQFPPVTTLVNRITQKSKNGSVVLMHLNVPDTAVASDQAIPMLREKGYKLVTVSELLQCGKQ